MSEQTDAEQYDRHADEPTVTGYEPDVTAGEEGLQPDAEPEPSTNVDLQAEQYEQARVDPDYADRMGIEVDPDDVEVLVPPAGSVLIPLDDAEDDTVDGTAEDDDDADEEV